MSNERDNAPSTALSALRDIFQTVIRNEDSAWMKMKLTMTIGIFIVIPFTRFNSSDYTPPDISFIIFLVSIYIIINLLIGPINRIIEESLRYNYVLTQSEGDGRSRYQHPRRRWSPANLRRKKS